MLFMLPIAKMMYAHHLLQHVGRLGACHPLRFGFSSFNFTLRLNLLYFVSIVWVVDVGEEYRCDVIVIEILIIRSVNLRTNTFYSNFLMEILHLAFRAARQLASSQAMHTKVHNRIILRFPGMHVCVGPRFAASMHASAC